MNLDFDNISDEKFSPPKITEKRKSKWIYADQLICFAALTIMAAWRSGPRALVLISVSILIAILVDIICCAIIKKTYNPRDLSTITTGFCIALMMPVSVSYPLIIFGSTFAIGIKHIFGGKNNYIFNPTSVALAFLIICYQDNMQKYPKPGEILPIFGDFTVTLSSGIESFLLKLGTANEMSMLDVLLGNFHGPMGTTHVMIILVCAICMLFRRSISGLVTLSAFGTIIIIAALFPIYDNFMNTLVYELVGGYLLFGILFLANDPQTVPKSQLGRLYYGILIGVLAMLFRTFGKIEGSFVFAILSANAISLKLDSLVEGTMKFVYRFANILKTQISTYERFREQAQKGQTRNISDTQEIVIDPINYDMPPIDNKVIKINRKKHGFLTRTREKLAPSSEKGTEKLLGSDKIDFSYEKEFNLDIKKYTKEQFSLFLATISKLLDKFLKNKNPSKIETPVEPIRHITQKPSEDLNLTKEKEETEIDIIDFDELK